jgi:hypothetical protein
MEREGRRPAPWGGGRVGRLRIAALVNGRAAVHVLGSASLRTDAEDHRRTSSRVGGRGGGGGPGGRRPEVGCCRDGLRRSQQPGCDPPPRLDFAARGSCGQSWGVLSCTTILGGDARRERVRGDAGRRTASSHRSVQLNQLPLLGQPSSCYEKVKAENA